MADNIIERVLEFANRRLDAAAIELTNALKETLSVPVPRLVKGKWTKGQGQFQRPVIYRTSAGKSVLVARALPDAPPRKFEGTFRQRQTWERRTSGAGDLVRRVGTNDKRAREFEEGTHPYMEPTLARVRPLLERILGQGV